MMQNKTLIVIVGPTAVGKTRLSVEIAKRYQCPVISCDSRQFYREMSIGTAKPTLAEQDNVPHYFIDSLSIHDKYTAGIFEAEALSKLEEIFRQHDYCVVVGGSGLYINALCYGIDDIPSDPKIRSQLQQEWKEKGLEHLLEELSLCDPEYYKIADLNNPRRVLRALEVFRQTGKPYSSFRNNAPKKRPFSTIWIGLETSNEILFEKINQRVDEMLETGLLDEVKNLHKFEGLKALRTVGYQEFFSYLNGEIDFERALLLVKKNSRNYARKQLTWFRKNKEINWFGPDDLELIVEKINSKKQE